MARAPRRVPPPRQASLAGPSGMEGSSIHPRGWTAGCHRRQRTRPSWRTRFSRQSVRKLALPTLAHRALDEIWDDSSAFPQLARGRILDRRSVRGNIGAGSLLGGAGIGLVELGEPCAGCAGHRIGPLGGAFAVAGLVGRRARWPDVSIKRQAPTIASHRNCRHGVE